MSVNIHYYIFLPIYTHFEVERTSVGKNSHRLHLFSTDRTPVQCPHPITSNPFCLPETAEQTASILRREELYMSV